MSLQIELKRKIMVHPRMCPIGSTHSPLLFPALQISFFRYFGVPNYQWYSIRAAFPLLKLAVVEKEKHPAG